MRNQDTREVHLTLTISRRQHLIESIPELEVSPQCMTEIRLCLLSISLFLHGLVA